MKRLSSILGLLALLLVLATGCQKYGDLHPNGGECGTVCTEDGEDTGDLKDGELVDGDITDDDDEDDVITDDDDDNGEEVGLGGGITDPTDEDEGEEELSLKEK